MLGGKIRIKRTKKTMGRRRGQDLKGDQDGKGEEQKGVYLGGYQELKRQRFQYIYLLSTHLADTPEAGPFRIQL